MHRKEQNIMSMSNQAFLRLRTKVKINQDVSQIFLEDVAQVVASEDVEKKLKRTLIYVRNEGDGNLLVIDAIRIIRSIGEKFPNLTIQFIGSEETLVEVEATHKKSASKLLLILVWMILFIGSGLAIMNFHTDVSMAEVHQRIFYLLTGEHNNHPYLLQIPYSIGIGIGMIVFFNQIFRKRLNEEPSPLELEMYLYQENIEKYAKAYENKENRRGEHEFR
jgi:stage V sporulation protein AA